MTMSEVFDRLCGKRVSRIDFSDGSFVRCPTPMLVDFHDSDQPAEAWIEPFNDGLMLHFNANRISPSGESGMQAQSEPFGNIASVS